MGLVIMKMISNATPFLFSCEKTIQFKGRRECFVICVAFVMRVERPKGEGERKKGRRTSEELGNWRLVSPSQQQELMLYLGVQSWEPVSFSGTCPSSFSVEWPTTWKRMSVLQVNWFKCQPHLKDTFTGISCLMFDRTMGPFGLVKFGPKLLIASSLLPAPLILHLHSNNNIFSSNTSGAWADIKNPLEHLLKHDSLWKTGSRNSSFGWAPGAAAAAAAPAQGPQLGNCWASKIQNLHFSLMAPQLILGSEGS